MAARVWVIGLGAFLSILLGCDDAETDITVLRAVVWPEGDLIAAALPSEDHGILVAADGAIFVTLDGLTSWHRARVPANSGLRAISMLDATTGFAVGHGVILRTDDGGSHWVAQRIPGRAAEALLEDVATIDADRAIAVGRNGRRLRTRDGGGVWEDVSQETVEGRVPEDYVAVTCLREAGARCYAAGRTISWSEDGGSSWEAAHVEDAAGLPPFGLRLGGVDIGVSEREALVENAGRLAGDPVDFSVEAFVSAIEVERYAQDRDPSALFELIDARAGEVAGSIEAAGVSADRVELLGVPPWGYEDHLDDDPDFLSRYLAGRIRDRPGVVVSATERVEWTDLVAAAWPAGAATARTSDASSDSPSNSSGEASPAPAPYGGQGRRVIAVGRGGRVFELAPGETTFARRTPPSPHDLLAAALAGNRVVVAGTQGGLHVAGLEAGTASWQTPPIEGAGAFFESIRFVASAKEGGRLLALDALGRILTSVDEGVHWRLLSPPGAV